MHWLAELSQSTVLCYQYGVNEVSVNPDQVCQVCSECVRRFATGII